MEPTDGEAVNTALDQVGHAAASGKADGLKYPFALEAAGRDRAVTRADVVGIVIAEKRLAFEGSREGRHIFGFEGVVIAVWLCAEHARFKIKMLDFSALDLWQDFRAWRKFQAFVDWHGK